MVVKIKMNIDIPIYIATSNNFLPLLRPFAYLFNKYWGDDKEIPAVEEINGEDENIKKAMLQWATGRGL